MAISSKKQFRVGKFTPNPSQISIPPRRIKSKSGLFVRPGGTMEWRGPIHRYQSIRAPLLPELHKSLSPSYAPSPIVFAGNTMGFVRVVSFKELFLPWDDLYVVEATCIFFPTDDQPKPKKKPKPSRRKAVKAS